MEAKVSAKGMKYYQLEEEDVIRLNDGVEHMQHVKGMLEWDDDSKYLLVPGTGSFVLKGSVNESDDEILNDYIKHRVPNY
jgi:hypothetical protein